MTIRKMPKQARSQQRVDAILDAAAALFGEVGFAAVTTNQIAARAEVAIGSLYQFFENKEAILSALVDRYVGAMRAVSQSTLTSERATTLPMHLLVSEMVDGIAGFKLQEAGFNELFVNAGASSQLSEATVALHDETIKLVDTLIGLRFPALPPDRRRLCALVSVALVKGLIGLPDAPDRVPVEGALYEIKAALLAYMRDFLMREGLPVPEDMWMPEVGK